MEIKVKVKVKASCWHKAMESEARGEQEKESRKSEKSERNAKDKWEGGCGVE
jgi:hypothetical protein